jgi:hypothetical protein
MARPEASEIVKRYEEAKQIRARHESDWRMASAYCLPRQYQAWINNEAPPIFSGNANSAARRIAFDSTGVRSLVKYQAVMERIATPTGVQWAQLTVGDDSLAKSYRVRKFFGELNSKLYKKRYNPKARFIQASHETYASMGVYGMGPIFLGNRRKLHKFEENNFLYRAIAMRDIYVLIDADGNVDTVFRRLWLNKRQFAQVFPNETMPRALANKTSENDFVEFIHVVHPRTDYDPQAIDSRRHVFCASYLCVPDAQYIGEEGGFTSMPYLTPRTFTEAGDPYAFSPAIQCLASMGTASQVKKSQLKQGQRAGEPTYLAHDDGVMNGTVDLRPNAINFGGVDKQGRRLIVPLETGNGFQISDKLLQDERADIEDSFFAMIFKILMETPEMTATQVMDRVRRESALLSPTMGQLQSEFLGPGISREIELLTEMGEMPELPPELIEAQNQYEVQYTSPMAKGMYAEEVSGFMQALETAINLAAQTQDPSHLDHFNLNVAIPEMADRMAVPPRWMNDEATKKAIAEGRASQAQQDALLKNAAPLASAAKTMAQMEQ